MLSWSLKLFRVRGIQLAIHSSFFLLLAYVAWQGWLPDPSDPTAGGWLGAFWNVVILLAFFTCVVLHELGHSFTAMHFGVGVRRILLMPIGGMAEFDSIPRQPARELLITLAGPAVNFVIAGVLWLCVGLPHGWPLGKYDFMANARGFAQLLVHWNLIMGCFNLVPVFPMDGGRIFRAILATRLPYLRATRIAAIVGKVLALAGIVIAMFVLPHPSVLMAILFAFIFFAGEMEYRAVVRRERDDAHWRETLARFYANQRPVDEPPVLSP
ncbi:MAG TPA: site-2 protease family protein [Opitutaceae bacterium]|nr:site-2 protease family protein [Opitutaceae bacterium]